MEKKTKMTVCRHCGQEIAASARVCPHCGGKNKKPLYKRPWVWVVGVLLVLGIIGSTGGEEQQPAAGQGVASQATSAPAQPEQTPEPTPEIVYAQLGVEELMDALDANPLKAADTYEGQYVELTGRLATIDSAGAYISLLPQNDPFAIIGVHCTVKSEEQKQAIMEMSTDDVIVVRGKITSVGEVLGYYLDMESVALAEG